MRTGSNPAISVKYSVVDVNDIMMVLDMWGSNTVCEPNYECIDLNNLPSGMGG